MYSPHIDESQVKKLWKLKTLNEVLTGERKPMTEMVNEALEKYLASESKKVNLLIRDKDMMALSLQVMEHREKEAGEAKRQKMD